MTLHPPFGISSRLLPSIKVGDGTLSLEWVGDNEGRAVFKWYADIPAGEFSAADLKSGVGGCTRQEAFSTLLSFLGAAGESYAYKQRTGHEGENLDLFPREVVEWAYINLDELSSLHCELDENPNLIEE